MPKHCAAHRPEFFLELIRKPAAIGRLVINDRDALGFQFVARERGRRRCLHVVRGANTEKSVKTLP